MVNISTTVRGHYSNDVYLWAIIIRRFCDSYKPTLRQVLGPPELTTYKAFGACSTQKTSLIGQGFPLPSLHDVGLNPNNLACYHEPALPQVPGPLELTTYKTFGPYSTQKTSLIGGGSPALCVVPPHRRFMM
jgi:hypothetical protein